MPILQDPPIRRWGRKRAIDTVYAILDQESGYDQLMVIAPISSMLTAGFLAMLTNMSLQGAQTVACVATSCSYKALQSGPWSGGMVAAIQMAVKERLRSGPHVKKADSTFAKITFPIGGIVGYAYRRWARTDDAISVPKWSVLESQSPQNHHDSHGKSTILMIFTRKDGNFL